MVIKFKKLLSCVLALSMISATVVTNVIAAGNENTSYVLYENDFESYTGRAFATTVEAGTKGWTGITSPANLAVTKVDGNTWIDPTGASTWTFDMGEEMTTGKLYISYDVIVDVSAGDGNDPSEVKFKNASGTESTLIAIRTKSSSNLNFQYDVGLLSQGTNTTIKPYTAGATHRVDIVLDIDNNRANVSIDGETPVTFGRQSAVYVKELVFVNQNAVKYDNLKIAKMTDDSFTSRIGEVGYDTFDIKFSESAKAVTKSNIAVTDEDGNPVAVKNVTVDNFGKVVVTLENDLESETEYNVTLLNIKNVFGTELSTSELSFTTSVIPERETILVLDSPEDFAKGNLKSFESYTYEGVGVTKWSHSATEIKDENEAVTGYNPKGNDKLLIQFDDPAYAVGDIILEYRALVDTDTAVFKPCLNYALDGMHSVPPYITGSKYVYYNNKADREGNQVTVRNTDLRGAWHTHKIVFHVEEQTADIYLDGTKLGTYNYNNFDKFVKKGSYVELRVDWRVDEESTADVPYILFDYLKVTHEYVPNDTNFYILQQEIVDGTDETTSKPTKTVKTYALNLTGSPISGYFLGGVYNGDRLSNAGIVSGTAEHGQVLGGSKKFIIDDATDLQVKGFLWNATNLSPLCNPIVE